MGCFITDGLGAGTCGYGLNQINQLWLGNFADFDIDADGTPTAKTTPASGSAKFYEIVPTKNSASFGDKLALTGSNTKYRIHSVNFSYGGNLDNDLTDIIDGLSLGKFVAVAKVNDKYLLLGRTGALEADTDGANLQGSGDATSAEQGVVVALSGNNVESAIVMSAAAVTAFQGLIYVPSTL